MQIKVQKLNESFSKISGPESDLQKIANRLKVEEPGAFFNPLVQRGFKSPFVYFTKKFGAFVYKLKTINVFLKNLEKNLKTIRK